MDVTAYEGLEALEALKPEWDALLQSCAAPRPFLMHEWLVASWRHYGEGDRLLTVCFRDAGRLAGLVPLRAHGPGFRRQLSFAVSGADYPDFLVGAGAEWAVLEAFFQWLKDEYRSWDCVRLRGMWSGSPTDELVPVAAGLAGLAACGWRVDVCPYVALPATREEFHETMPGRRWQREHGARRMRKLAREHGEPVLRVTEAADVTRDTMARFLELHRKGWEERGGSAALNDERVPSFHFDLAASLAPTGVPALFWLVVGGREVACSYGFRMGRTFFGYMMAYDPEFAAYSVGRQLTLKIVERGIDEGWGEIDMLSGGERYKYDYTRRGRHTMDYAIAKSPAWLRLVLAVTALRGRSCP